VDPLPARAEVAIVGGGIAGLATAWALAERRDGDVVVLEREDALATHASGKNAAMCRALAEDDAWTAVTAEGAAFLREPPAGFARAPLVDRRGAVLLAGPSVIDELRARALRFALRCEHVGRGEIAARWPGLDVARSGLWFPDDGNIDLGVLVESYVAGARAGGVRVVTGAAVTAIVPEGGSNGAVAVHTARGAIDVEQVVIAAGAWSDEVAARAQVAGLGLISRRRHIMALRASAPDAPIVWDVDGDEWYVRPAGGEVWASACDSDVVGAGVVDARVEAEAEIRARLPRSVADAQRVRLWACQRTFAGGAPIVARDVAHPWLVRVVGLGGHGITASAAIGRLAASVVSASRR
jgi:glycine/D-amino acid oxidase-like deaminating enzyme